MNMKILFLGVVAVWIPTAVLAMGEKQSTDIEKFCTQFNKESSEELSQYDGKLTYSKDSKISCLPVIGKEGCEHYPFEHRFVFETNGGTKMHAYVLIDKGDKPANLIVGSSYKFCGSSVTGVTGQNRIKIVRESIIEN